MKTHSDLMEDVTEAASPFNIIEEDDVDDDFEPDFDVFVNSIYTYIHIYIFSDSPEDDQRSKHVEN